MLKPIEGKIKLELNYPGDGRVFLNFWDSIHGNDVCAEINGAGELIKDGKNIDFYTFWKEVEDSINKRINPY